MTTSAFVWAWFPGVWGPSPPVAVTTASPKATLTATSLRSGLP
jgi:hypothetical protein